MGGIRNKIERKIIDMVIPDNGTNIFQKYEKCNL